MSMIPANLDKPAILDKPVDLELLQPPKYCRKVDRSVIDVDDPEPGFNLEVSNPAKLLLLCEKLVEHKSSLLEAKVNKYLKSESESESVFLINLYVLSEVAVIKTIDEEELDSMIRLTLAEGTVRKLVKYQENGLTCADELDPQILDLYNAVLQGHKNKEIIAVPVLDRGECQDELTKDKTSKCTCSLKGPKYPVLLACYVNSKKDATIVAKLTQECFKVCLALLLSAARTEEEGRKKRQCQDLLLVARKLFSHLEDVDELLRLIMSDARHLTNAERCSLFLLEPGNNLVARVFDGMSHTSSEVRIPKDQGIAGHVTTTGKLININDAYKHPMFYKGLDEATGFKTRNILCFPIRDENGIIGVAQLCNKKGGNFDFFDEEVAEAFSIYCGISIVHSLIYKRIEDSQDRNNLSNELMMYPHKHVNPEEIQAVTDCPKLHTQPDFDRFIFCPRVILNAETPCYVIRMFEDLNFINLFKINKTALVRFILFIHQGYRNVPYHNWMHAFSVAHFAYLCIVNFKLMSDGYLTSLEAFALVIACICHDLDHRGTTNSFQKVAQSVLAALYSSDGSVMERHHLAQTICTINTEGCNFLESLNRKDYKLCLDLVKDMILATDLANHFKLLDRQTLMAQEGYNRNNPEHRYALVCLIMTCADLSDQTKEWLVTKRVASFIYDEFFTQGDMEKNMGRTPLPMMDRDQANIPELQIEFLKEIVLPTFKLLVKMFPAGKILVNTIKKNILSWEASRIVFNRLIKDGQTPMDILGGSVLEQEVPEILKKVSAMK